MINTTLTIFGSLRKKLNELTRHGKMDPNGFKDILYAVILNNMIKWADYIPKSEDSEKLTEILNNYILDHGSFIIERIPDQKYTNTNTPQDNTDWQAIKGQKTINVDRV